MGPSKPQVRARRRPGRDQVFRSKWMQLSGSSLEQAFGSVFGKVLTSHPASSRSSREASSSQQE